VGFFDFLFGGGETTVVETHVEQAAAQAANVTVNPSTTVSLAIDTSDLAQAFENMTKENAEIAGREQEILEKQYQATLELGQANILLGGLNLAQDAEYAQAEIDASNKWQEFTETFSGKMYQLLKAGLLGLGVVLLVRGGKS